MILIKYHQLIPNYLFTNKILEGELMIVIVGESGSGKSSIEKELEKNHNYNRVITYTTRPKREREQDGKDYYFVNDNSFLNLASHEFFVETTSFKGWYYGTPKDSCNEDSVIVVNPHGLRQLKYKGIKFISFYIKVPREDRMIKMLQRGDNIEEAYRRNLSDVGMFTGIEDEVDHVIENIGYRHTVKDMANIIVKCIKEKK